MKSGPQSVCRTLFACFLVVLALGGVLPAVSQDAPVYISKSGQKYHRIDCRALRSSKQKISLKDALNAGYEACALCAPAAPSGGSALNAAVPYRVNAAGLSSYKLADTRKMLGARVTRHVDGDTVHITIENPPTGLKKVEKVRMIGVDTPETAHPNRGLEYFGAEASAFTKDALLGKDVFIALDWDTRDKYGRLLAYIYTADGECHNASLIKQGFSRAYTRFPFQFLDEFRTLEQKSRSAKKGLWADRES